MSFDVLPLLDDAVEINGWIMQGTGGIYLHIYLSGGSCQLSAFTESVSVCSDVGFTHLSIICISVNRKL